MREQEEQAALRILRRFEPIVHYTRGERFFPVDVERYLQQCSLWMKPLNKPPVQLVAQGNLTIEELVKPRMDGFETIYYLKFIEPLDLDDLARYSIKQMVKSLAQRDEKDVFHAGWGRLARVGYGSRFVAALFSLTLLLRGRVPGDTAAAAMLTYEEMQRQVERYVYYGRVVYQDGWVVLQYWYFYPFNNWRSGFFGVNDHEGDWEMVSVFCYNEGERATTTDDQTLPEAETLTPQWVAYASHDFSGDDLRRRWDDSEVEKIGNHVVVFAGAGSHASYYARGEYLAEIELPFLSPLVKLVETIKRIWTQTFHQARPRAETSAFNVFRIPFVDYARGDGWSIGLGMQRVWEPRLLSEQTPWAEGYRGLWGLYAQDPISGENAPAGPVYNRDCSVRRRWFDPLGWAGLDKVPPPNQALDFLEQQRKQSLDYCAELTRAIEEKSSELAGLGVNAAALDGQAHLSHLHTQYSQRVAALSSELAALRKQLVEESAKREALNHYEERLHRNDFGPARAHIRRAHRPATESSLGLNIFTEFLASVNIGVFMIGVVLMALFARQYVLLGLAVLIGAMIFAEATFRGQLARLINSLTVGLAIVAALVLLYEFFWEVIVVAVLTAGLFIIWENLRELRH